MQLFKHKREEGFTIIEIMIVLTIAAVILLIVFLAVPALERASHNNGRRSDASRLAAAVSTFVSNNEGVLPCVTTPQPATNDATTIFNDAGTMAQFNFSGGENCTAIGTYTANEFTVDTKAPVKGTKIPGAVDNAAVVFINAQCGTDDQGWAVADAGSRDAALVYPVQVGSGYQWTCISAL